MIKLFSVIILTSNLLWSSVAIVKKTTGNVEVKRNKTVKVIVAGELLYNGDIILTKVDSSVGITFDDGSRLSLGQKAVFVIKKFLVKPSKDEYDVDLNLKKGKAVFSSGKVGKLAPEAVKFRIPEGIVGIRGTKFAVEAK